MIFGNFAGACGEKNSADRFARTIEKKTLHETTLTFDGSMFIERKWRWDNWKCSDQFRDANVLLTSGNSGFCER